MDLYHCQSQVIKGHVRLELVFLSKLCSPELVQSAKQVFNHIALFELRFLDCTVISNGLIFLFWTVKYSSWYITAVEQASY